jgi:hypothetical protein
VHSQDRASATLCHPRLQHACDIPSPPSSCTWRLGPTIPKYVSGTIALPTFESPACAMVLAVPSSRRLTAGHVAPFDGAHHVLPPPLTPPRPPVVCAPSRRCGGCARLRCASLCPASVVGRVWLCALESSSLPRGGRERRLW